MSGADLYDAMDFQPMTAAAVPALAVYSGASGCPVCGRPAGVPCTSWCDCDNLLPWADEVPTVIDVDDIDTDLRYALRQLRSVRPGQRLLITFDHVARALDALERIDNTLQKAAEDAAGF